MDQSSASPACRDEALATPAPDSSPVPPAPAAITFDAPVWLDGWRYTVRYWSPAAWALMPDADRPANARRMNDDGWRWEWACDGPSPELIRRWEEMKQSHRAINEDPRCCNLGPFVPRGESYSTNPPTDWGRIAAMDYHPRVGR